jgi:hypoxanthine phosphoribosyltransferase
MKVDYKYKAKITDDIVDAHETIRVTAKMLQEGKIDKASALDNLSRAMKKLEAAKYYIDRG